MDKTGYSVGLRPTSWKSDGAQTITFIVTDDCNLRCKYCYITHKSAEKKMSLDTAKKFVDYILTADINYAEAVILEFIGGEPMMEAELISQICDYFKVKAFLLGHPWYWNYRISICTNGVNYTSDAVQALIARNRGKISVTITIDGTKQKHDLQRVFPDGSGSYDTIEKGIDLWLSQFRGSTKVTFASDDLPLLKESVISLWNRGVTEVASNVVFEDVWKDGDDALLEEQLISLADYILDNKLYDSGLICTFFDESLGSAYTDEDFYKTFCGAGKMLAFSADGDIYPCLRYYGHSLNNHESWPIGNLKTGIDMERVRPFMAATTSVQSDAECLACEIASACPFCQGFNYDQAETPTNFHRAKYNCKMHKARVRANDYYFSKLKNMYGVERKNAPAVKKSLYILLANDYVTYCSYANASADTTKMSNQEIVNALKYAREHFMRPIFVHSKSSPLLDLPAECVAYDIMHILPAEAANKAHAHGLKDILPVFDLANLGLTEEKMDNCILNVAQTEIGGLSDAVKKLFEKAERVNLNITGLTAAFDEQEYERQLRGIKAYLLDDLHATGKLKELNVLTDVCFLKKHDNCQAGENHFSTGVGGQLYTCPAFFSTMPQQAIGSVQEGVTRKHSARLYDLKNNPICGECDAYQCRNCVYTNYTATREVNVSPSFQCRKSHIERAVSAELLEVLKENDSMNAYVQEKDIPALAYLDPITRFFEKAGGNIGTYQYCQN